MLNPKYDATKEAIYQTRDFVGSAVKKGYKAPAAHMTEIAAMLAYYEDQRAIARKKVEERAKSKAAVSPRRISLFDFFAQSLVYFAACYRSTSRRPPVPSHRRFGGRV